MASKGLYSPQFEHDSCGIGFVANIKSQKSHQIVSDSLTILENMEHRGACGCENNTGDGAGILVQIPHEFLKARCASQGLFLPEPGQYGVGAVFTSPIVSQQGFGQRLFEQLVKEEGLPFLGWRRLAPDNAA